MLGRRLERVESAMQQRLSLQLALVHWASSVHTPACANPVHSPLTQDPPLQTTSQHLLSDAHVLLAHWSFAEHCEAFAELVQLPVASQVPPVQSLSQQRSSAGSAVLAAQRLLRQELIEPPTALALQSWPLVSSVAQWPVLPSQ